MRNKGAQEAERSAGRIAARWDRRSASALAAFLYFLLVFVLPGLHIALHSDDHDHGGGGQRLITAAFPLAMPARSVVHSHGSGAPHVHAPAVAQRIDLKPAAAERHAVIHSGRTDSPASPDPHHGAGSLAHFAGSLLPGSALIDLPLAGLVSGEAGPLSPPYVVPRSTLLSSLHARAPPPMLAS